MGVISLPQSMEQDRLNQIKANSVHVDENFNALLTAVNRKLEIDGSIVPTADLPMGSHKITGVATPTLSGDATNKGYVDSALLLKADLASPTFTGNPEAPTQTNTDNSTKIATTAFVKNVLDAIWPVNSMFFGTQSTCPLAAFFGTWTKVGTSIVTSVNSTAGVKGTGKTLGLTNGSKNVGIKGQVYAGSNLALGASTLMYDKNNGTTGGDQWDGNDIAGGLGVVTSSSTSGLTADITSSSLTVNIWERTA